MRVEDEFNVPIALSAFRDKIIIIIIIIIKKDLNSNSPHGQSAANWRNTHTDSRGSHAFTRTIISTQLQPLHNLKSIFFSPRYLRYLR